jgi:hypothetical protein
LFTLIILMVKGSISVSEVELELNVIRSYTPNRWSGIVINHRTTTKDWYMHVEWKE